MVKKNRDNWEQHWLDFDAMIAANPASAYRRRLILGEIRAWVRPGNILDIGSGQGDLSADLASAFPSSRIRGLELSSTGVAISARKVPAAEFIKFDIMSKKKVPTGLLGWADAAVCSEVLEHLDDPRTFLNRVSKFLRPGARLYVTVPRGPRSAYEEYVGHRRHFTATDLRRLLESSGYEVNRVFKAGFPFFNLYKVAGLLRGSRLLDDISDPGRHKMRFAARLALGVFSYLFKANLRNSPWGWQLIAITQKAGVNSERMLG